LAGFQVIMHGRFWVITEEKIEAGQVESGRPVKEVVRELCLALKRAEP